MPSGGIPFTSTVVSNTSVGDEHRVVHLELLPGTERRARGSPGEVLLAPAEREEGEAEEREQSVPCAKHNHERGKEFEVNGAGSSWSSDQCDSAPAVVQLVISSDGANSASTCRQIPQGAPAWILRWRSRAR